MSQLLKFYHFRSSYKNPKIKAMRPDPVLLLVISDVFSNLSAGFWGAIIVIPIVSGSDLTFNLFALTMDAMAAIVTMLVAYRLRKHLQRNQ